MDAKTNLKSKLPSRHVTEGPSRAPHRSYYYAMGLTKEQIHQPFEGNPGRGGRARRRHLGAEPADQPPRRRARDPAAAPHGVTMPPVLQTRYVFTITALIREAISAGDVGHGVRRIIPITGGEVRGQINGKVLPFGMDSSVKATVVPNEITRWATKILGLYLGQNTMVPSIRIYQERRLNMQPFFTKVIPFEEGLCAFDLLGLDMKTLQHKPKSAMKIVMKM